MAGFIFRFERVLKVKETRERQHQLSLAEALRRAEDARAAVDALRASILEREAQTRELVQTRSVETWRLELAAGYLDV